MSVVIQPNTTEIKASHKGGMVVVNEATSGVIVACSISIPGTLGLVTGDNVGGGDAEVFRDKIGTVLNFRTLSGLDNMSIAENGDVIEFDALPSGVDTQLQFNDNGKIGAADVFWDKATSVLDIPGLITLGSQLEIEDNDLKNVNSILFDTTPVNGCVEGRMLWDVNEGTLCLGMVGGTVNLQVGQEFLVRVRNNTGVTITNGQVVYITGGIGNRPTVALADNSDLPQSAVLGMATENILDNTDGYVASEGKVNDINTASWAPGTIMWLGSSGAIQPTRPDAPAYTVGVGQIVQQNPTQGSITMRPVIIPKLTNLSDVNVRETVLADKDLLWWDLSNLRWDRVTIGSLNSSLDHGLLEASSLLDNDHTQYTLRSDWLQNGFPDRTTSTLTWTDSTPDRTLSIQPTGASFVYFVNGIPYVSTGDTVQITDVEGLHWIYYDGATLTSLANPTIIQEGDIIQNKALVSCVYWDTSAGSALYVGEERHSSSMSPDTHAYLHFIEGLRYETGLGLNTLSVDGTGITADAQFGIDAGIVADEDLAIAPSAVASTVGFPIYYRTGASGEWNRHVEAGFSVRTYDGTSGTRLAWNEWTGSAWQLSQVASNQFVLCHVFATTEKDKPIIAVMGQNDYLNKPQAQAGATTEIQELVLAGLPLPEIRPLATVIFQTNLGYANAVNGKVVSTAEGDDYVDWRSETISRAVVSTTDHGSLTGKGDDDHPQYALADGTRAFTGAVTIAGSTDTEQLVIKAYSGQSVATPLMEFQDSAGTPMLAIHSNDYRNMFFGVGAGASVTTGTDLYLYGYSAGGSLQSGDSNIAIGLGALANCVTGSKNVALGVHSLGGFTGSNTIAIGSAAGRYQTGGQSIFIGREAGEGVSGSSIGDDHVCIGYFAGTKLTSAIECTLVGCMAGFNLTSSANSYATAIGHEAMYSLNNGAACVALGRYALHNATSGDHSVALGYDASGRNIGGDYNVNVGNYAGRGKVSHSYSESTSVGYAAGLLQENGAGANCFFGYRAGDNVSTASYCIIIGHDLEAASATTDYQLNIGGTITGDLNNGDVVIKRHLEIDGLLQFGGQTNTEVALRRTTTTLECLLADASDRAYFSAYHIGLNRDPTATHLLIGTASFTATGTVVGYGCFPEYAPASSATNIITSIQGNTWFSTTNWAAGSRVQCLDFYPAPLLAGTTFGSANLDISAINTAGMLNILGRTVTANTITGIAVTPITNIFGGTDNTTANIVRGMLVGSAVSTTGTWGRLTGLEIQPQTSGVINQGLWMVGDGIGCDIVLGAGSGGNGDARLYYDGSNCILDPDVIGSGRVYIGATGDDDMLLNDIEIDGDLNHDGSNLGVFDTAPTTKQTVTGSRGGNVALASLLTALAAYGLVTDSTT